MKKQQIFAVTGLAAIALLAGCASTPKQDDAAAQQQTQQATQDAAQAEQPKVEAAKDMSGPAADAIAAARASVSRAKEIGAQTADAEKSLAGADSAFQAKNYDSAIAQANDAKKKADAAYNERRLAQARALLAEAKGYSSGMTAEQMARLQEAEQAIARGEGDRAYQLLTGLIAEVKAATMNYSVVRGDSLWKISGKQEVYGNPYQWPLIYKANKDKIKDADLIYPGQALSVRKNASQAEIDAAVTHARTRGAWSLGKVEESDRAYLAK